MQLEQKLLEMQEVFSRVINFSNKKLLALDFTENNHSLLKVKIEDTKALSQLIDDALQKEQADIGYGGYNEDRVIYKRSEHFGNKENARSIHLGTDIWCPAFTAVHTPLDAKIHSFKINDNFGDYGPTIILEHHTNELSFYTLYGHLSEQSLAGKQTGQFIRKGEKFAEIGAEHENGQWPPHLHFQIIKDMQGFVGDFPGVCKKSERKKFLALCPDPKIILSI